MNPSDQYLTPPDVMALVREVWPGGIELDPFGHADSHVDARREYRLDGGEDAYALPWDAATVYVNGPYSSPNPSRTAAKLVEEHRAGRAREVISVTMAAVGSRYWSRYMWPHYGAVAFLGRSTSSRASTCTARTGVASRRPASG